MKKRYIAAFLVSVLAASIFSGCAADTGGISTTGGTPDDAGAFQTEPVETQPPMTTPPDGDPNDVTCKGSYTVSQPNADKVVATVGEKKLTNGVLQAYYWQEVAAYREEEHEFSPDFEKPLDMQVCEIDGSVFSWQQYFLRRALNTWHAAQALAIQADEKGIPTEEAYQPNLENHEKYMVDIPATKFLYGYHNNYRVNTLHQAYLDSLPEKLETIAKEQGYPDGEALAKAADGTTVQALLESAELYNLGYMYFTALSYELTTTDEEVEAWFDNHAQEYAEAGISKDGSKLVNLRQILMQPQEIAATKDKEADPVKIESNGKITCSEAVWEANLKAAQDMVKEFENLVTKNYHTNARSTRDAIFADYAHRVSQDTDTAPDGGRYSLISKGELIEPLDTWLFDEARQSGDVGVVRSEYGYHILFYTDSVETWYYAAQQDLLASKQAEEIQKAKKAYPAKIEYSAIALAEPGEGAGSLSWQQLLYADLGHERYPEIPLYLQQDYPNTMYGNYKVSSHGCGITTMSMLASYMSDAPMTVPVMCAKYGSYCYSNGTDGKLFVVAPSEMNFYLKKQTYNANEAKQALADGYVVVCVQTKGYWTRGGHYLALEKLVEGQPGETEPRVQVRDSNIFNYGRLEDHKLDAFLWNTIPPAAQSWWIYENKNVTFAACSRCGNPDETTCGLLGEDYICLRCRNALLRRNDYLNTVGA